MKSERVDVMCQSVEEWVGKAGKSEKNGWAMDNQGVVLYRREIRSVYHYMEDWLKIIIMYYTCQSKT